MDFIKPINQFSSPTFEDLKKMIIHDSNFAKRTRYLFTENGICTFTEEACSKSTWAFTSLEKNFPEIAKACSYINQKLGHRVQCNAYYTPANTQGMPVHYDLHDVILIQLEGSKIWHRWPAFRRNVSIETLKMDEKENTLTWTKEAPGTRQVLKKNDSLVIKKGEPHVGITTSEHSLHLSFGIYND